MWRPAAAFGLLGRRDQWRQRLVVDEPFGQNGVVTALGQRDEARLQSLVPIARQMGGMAGLAQKPPHLARPRFFLDLDRRLKFPQVVCVAQCVKWCALHNACSTPVNV